MIKRADMINVVGRQRDKAAGWIPKGIRPKNGAIYTNRKSVLILAKNSFKTGLL